MILRELQLIAKREGKYFKDIVNMAFREYVDKHGAGNSQTKLASFTPNGEKAIGLIETECFNYFSKFKTDLKHHFLHEYLRGAGLDDARTRIASVARISQRLKKEKGINVWANT